MACLHVYGVHQALSIDTQCGIGRTFWSHITESLEADLGPSALVFHEVQPRLYLRTLSTSSCTNYSSEAASKGVELHNVLTRLIRLTTVPTPGWRASLVQKSQILSPGYGAIPAS
ncbi:hypothetical protein PV10_06112 [Exophiala mesophila]|uniref:Uncharacterized protein n=1 Tax=Exophiala mesophila TaxID=212818 RepID=A0A0D1ZA97_EXOME|nr:uncharacterized protein PV10_06112 [Exophiala mesophila]KIV91592.1 hypothetical protein PV10_06112 [Exophiala mesophila]